MEIIKIIGSGLRLYKVLFFNTLNFDSMYYMGIQICATLLIMFAWIIAIERVFAMRRKIDDMDVNILNGWIRRNTFLFRVTMASLGLSIVWTISVVVLGVSALSSVPEEYKAQAIATCISVALGFPVCLIPFAIPCLAVH
jgi:hypothetical protein